MRKIKILLGIVLCVLVFSNSTVWGKTDKSRTEIKESETVLPKKDLERLTTIITAVKKYYYKLIDYDTTVSIDGLNINYFSL